MNLYNIHCGFYDEEIFNGIYEFHINIPVAAKTIEEAKIKGRQLPIFQKKKMHIDGIQEIKIVSGYQIILDPTDDILNHVSVIENYQHRDL